MNRRSFFNSVIPSPTEKPVSPKAQQNALDPYNGMWTDEERKHLLRRTMFGFTPQDVLNVSTLSMNQIVDQLLSTIEQPLQPIAYVNSGSVTAGNSWATTTYDANLEAQRFTFLQSWQINEMMQQPIRIHDKMVLFWQNHFATGANSVKDARYMYKQASLFYQSALGNVKDLTRAIIFDLAMLRYLNGNTNTKKDPNENLARELQELFTIGKGKEISPGNYTNYTEADIKEAARILTGWSDDQTGLKTIFKSANHDIYPKQFSPAYQETLIKSSGSTEIHAKAEVDELLTMIFKQQATSSYLVRKLYRYFVDYVIDDSVEEFIIQPLALLYSQSNFEIKPVLNTLLKSTHFYSMEIRGCFIKTPADLVIGTSRFFHPDMVFPEEQNLLHWAYRTFRKLMGTMGQDLMNPPNVAGIPAYYQEPSFHELWINADTLQKRIKFVNDLCVDHLQLDEMAYGKGALIDVVKAAELCDTPSDPSALISTWCNWFYALPIEKDIQYSFKRLLTGGLEDTVWTNAWNDYKNDPSNADKLIVIETKLRNLMKHMLSMAEYQLM